MKATIQSGKIKAENGIEYPLTKKQDIKGYSEGQQLKVKTFAEYPAGCDENAFCPGDETCMECMQIVAEIIK